METSYGLSDTTAPQTTMITLTGSRLMVQAMFMLLVKAWKPVLTTISPQSNTHQMVMNFGFAITMVPPMVMTQANPSRSMQMATPTSQVITLWQPGLSALLLSIQRQAISYGPLHLTVLTRRAECSYPSHWMIPQAHTLPASSSAAVLVMLP